MKSGFYTGLVAGAALTAAALVGYAYGADRAVTPEDVEASLEANYCRVRVGYGSLTPGDQCRYNQVQVGTRSGYLLCADIEVTCDE